MPAIAVVSRPRDRSQAEIGDADLPLAIDHDVGGLEVAVQDAALVRGGQARAQLTREIERLVLRAAARSAAAATPRSSPSTYSIVRNGRPSTSPTSYMRQTFLCATWRAKPDLGVELRQADGVGFDGSGRNFNATGWPSFRSSAR